MVTTFCLFIHHSLWPLCGRRSDLLVNGLHSGASNLDRALARDIVLCSWARHLTLTLPLSTQVYKWVSANLMLGGNPAMDWHPIQGGAEILLVTSCYWNRGRRWPDEPLGSYVYRRFTSNCGRMVYVYLYMYRTPDWAIWFWKPCQGLELVFLGHTLYPETPIHQGITKTSIQQLCASESRDKHQPDGLLVSNTDLTLYVTWNS